MPRNMRIGIEGVGRTTTVAVLSQEDGQILAAVREPRGLDFYEMPPDQLAAEIFGIMKKLLAYVNKSVSTFSDSGGRICAGISGITTKRDRVETMPGIWESIGLNPVACLSTGDIEICVPGAIHSLFGGGVLCTAGSSAMARTANQIKRVGGWGPLFGDEGSGYWIGIRALNALTLYEDGRSETDCSVLKREILSELSNVVEWKSLTIGAKSDSEKVDALVNLSKLVDFTRFRELVSYLVKAVFRAAEQNDKSAAAIVNESTNALVQQLEVAFRKISLNPANIPIMLWGGAIRYNTSFRERLVSTVRKRWPNSRVIVPGSPGVLRPVLGSLLFTISGNLFTMPGNDVLSNVCSSARTFSELVDY